MPKITQSNRSVPHVVPQPDTFLPKPTGYTKEMADFFHSLCRMVNAQVGISEIDSGQIEMATEALFESRELSKQSRKALKKGDLELYKELRMQLSRARGEYHRAASALKVTPSDRSGKATKELRALTAADESNEWGHLLD